MSKGKCKCECCSRDVVWEHERKRYASDDKMDDGITEMEEDGWQVATMGVYWACYDSATLFYDIIFKRVKK